MESSEIILICIFVIVLVISILSVYCCQKDKIINYFRKSQTKEGFISAGADGAYFNEKTNAIVGPNLYTNQMIQNDKTWNDIIEGVKKNGIANDGPNMLGAGKGRGFDKEMKNQEKYNDYLTHKNKLSNDEMNKITRAINDGIANSLGEISLFNRGKQVAGKLIIQDGWNSTMSMMDEKYYSERQKNRNIYTATKIIHTKGFDINPENLGKEFIGYNQAKVLQKNSKRIPYVSEAIRPNTGISVENGKLVLENDKTKMTTDIEKPKKAEGVIETTLDNGQTMAGMRANA